MIGLRAQMGARRRSASTGVAPTITVAPVLAWTGGIGSSPVLTDPTYTGDPGTITWTYYRDGVADGTILNVNKATAEAYVAAWSGTETGVNDMVERVFRATVTNGAGSDFDDSNAQFYDDTVLIGSGGTTLDDLVLADGDTTVDQWGASIGSAGATTLAALSASTRLAYSATGGVGSRPLATADGAADVLRGAMVKASAWATAEIGIVGAQVSDIQGSFATFIAYGNTRIRVARNGAGGVRGVWHPNQATSTPGLAALAVPTHWSTDGTATSTLTLRSGGSSLDTDTAGAGPADGFNVSLGGFDTGSAGNAANWAFQAWYMLEQLTADQRLDLRALLTARTGVAC